MTTTLRIEKADALEPVLRAEAEKVEGQIMMYETARATYTEAVKREMQMQAEKPGKKATAIALLMTQENPLTKKLHSASSAEAVVEAEEGYAAWLLNFRTQVAVKMRAETECEAAKMRAHLQLAVLKIAGGLV